MAQIDASIYNALMQPQKSALDYAEQYAQADDRKAQRAMNALAMEDQAGYRAALAAAPQDEAGRIRALIGSANPLAIKHGQEMQKAGIDALEKRTKITKEQGEATDAAIKRYRGSLDYIDTPQGAARWLQAQYQDPATAGYMSRLGPLEQSLSRIPQDPAQFDNWRRQAGMGMEAHIKQLQSAQDYQLKVNNELIGPDGKVNQPLLNARKEVAKSGASNISMNSGQKGLDNEFKLRGEFKSEPVYKAHQEMQSAYSQIKQAIDQASPAGDLAAATKIMKLLDPGSVVRESELGMAMQASGLADRIQNFVPNILSGQKLTPEQRKDFRKLADALYSTSVEQFNAKRSEYDKLGSEYGLNSGRALGPNSANPTNAKPAQQGGNVIRFDANGNPIK